MATTEIKSFTFVQGSTTIVKTFSSSTSPGSYVVKAGGVPITLTSAEFTDLAAMIDAALAKTYTDA